MEDPDLDFSTPLEMTFFIPVRWVRAAQIGSTQRRPLSVT